MKLNTIQRILKEDLARGGGELPPWLDALLTPLNNVITQFFVLSQNNNTLADNIACLVLTNSFKSGTRAAVQVASTQRVKGIMPIDAAGNLITGFGYTRNSDGTLGVVFKFTDLSGSAVTTAVNITFVVFF